MRRGQGQQSHDDGDGEESHDPAAPNPPVHEPAVVQDDNGRRQVGDLFGKKVNDGGGAGIAHQQRQRPQNRDRVRQTFSPSGPSLASTTATQRQRLRPIATTTGWWSNRTLHPKGNCLEC